MFICSSNTATTKIKPALNDFTITLCNKVSFQETADTTITLEGTSSSSNDDKTRPTAQNSRKGKSKNCKLAIAFGICCVFLLFLLPIIFYYVGGGSEVTGELSPTQISQVCQALCIANMYMLVI